MESSSFSHEPGAISAAFRLSSRTGSYPSSQMLSPLIPYYGCCKAQPLLLRNNSPSSPFTFCKLFSYRVVSQVPSRPLSHQHGPADLLDSSFCSCLSPAEISLLPLAPALESNALTGPNGIVPGGSHQDAICRTYARSDPKAD